MAGLKLSLVRFNVTTEKPSITGRTRRSDTQGILFRGIDGTLIASPTMTQQVGIFTFRGFGSFRQNPIPIRENSIASGWVLGGKASRKLPYSILCLPGLCAGYLEPSRWQARVCRTILTSSVVNKGWSSASYVTLAAIAPNPSQKTYAASKLQRRRGMPRR